MSIWKCDILTVIPGRFSRQASEGTRGGLRRRNGTTTTTTTTSTTTTTTTKTTKRTTTTSRGGGTLFRGSSEIVALPCLRASYRRYLFRRAAKQLAGPVGPANR
ncbi:hypothetical protein PUN28_018163 [Cardiocondyla obscurior]|uniref:Uncharacterized protein n=1 Tax=Cardiocondyla obscurior TaxID=286306 RepID=A0AAW2EG37_9HYME